MEISDKLTSRGKLALEGYPVKIFSSDETQEIREDIEKKMEPATREFRRRQFNSRRDAEKIYLQRPRVYHFRP